MPNQMDRFLARNRERRKNEMLNISSFKDSFTFAPNTRTTVLSKGRIKRKQRGDPPAPQGQVVMTVNTASNKIRRTYADSKAVAPMSDDVTVDRLIRGEICFMDADCYDSRGVRPGLNGGPMVQVTTNLNGWPIDANFCVVGVITNAGMGKGQDNSKDNAGTAVLAGTAGTTNTGPNIIPAFSHVVAVPIPYQAKDAQGNIVPAFEDPGLPSTKFLVATHALNSASVLTLIKRIQGTVYETFDLKAPTTSDQLRQELLNNNMNVLDIHETHPLFLYSTMFAASLLNYWYPAGRPMPWPQAVEFSCHALNIYNSWDYKVKNRFATSLQIYDQKLVNKHYRAAEYLSADPKDALSEKFKKEVIMMCDNARSNLQEKQHDCYNQTYVGLATNTSASGKPLSLILGNSHW